MSYSTGAIAAVNAVGGLVQLGFDIWNAVEQRDLQKKQLKLYEQALKQQREQFNTQLQFGKNIYNDWKAAFGDTQQELGEYYKTLTADSLKTQYEMANTEASNNLLQQYNAAQKQMNAQYNKLGISNSGAAVAANLQLQSSMMQQRATNNWKTALLKQQAQSEIMAQKQAWVNTGQQQFNTATQIINNATANYATSYGNEAQNAYATSINADKSFWNSINNISSMTSGVLLGAGTGMMRHNNNLELEQEKAKNKTLNYANSISNNSIWGGNKYLHWGLQ